MLLLNNNDINKFKIKKLMQEHEEYKTQELNQKKLEKQFLTVRECYYNLIDIGMIKELESLYWQLESEYYRTKLP